MSQKNIGSNITSFIRQSSEFAHVVVDLGCGDGRFVYKNALTDPNHLFIGIDPAIKQADEYAKKINRHKVKNAAFMSGSFELLPKEVLRLADKLYVTLPWGTLLRAIVRPTPQTVTTLKFLLKPTAELELLFGYNPKLELSQTTRLDLPVMDSNYVASEIVPVFEQNGFKLKEFKTVSGNELKNVESNWGKRISATENRQIFKLVFSL